MVRVAPLTSVLSTRSLSLTGRPSKTPCKEMLISPSLKGDSLRCGDLAGVAGGCTGRLRGTGEYAGMNKARGEGVATAVCGLRVLPVRPAGLAKKFLR